MQLSPVPSPTSEARPFTLAWFTHSRAALFGLFALYAVPRLLILLIPVTPTSDADYYYKQADRLAHGIGYLANNGDPTAFWPVGWPMMLASLFNLFGTSTLLVGLFNVLCGLLSAWLVLDLGRKLFGSEAAARAALLLLALYPNNIGYFALALTEVFYTFLLLAICWLLIVKRGAPAFIAAGLLLGAATMVKAQSLVVVPIILGIAMVRTSPFLKQLLPTAARFVALIALAAMVIAPWTLRNQRELGAFVAVSTNGGITLYTGNNDSATGDYTPNDPAVQALYARNLDELTFDAEAKRLAVEWIKADPVRFIGLMPKKLFRLWGPDGEAEWGFQGGYARYDRYETIFSAVRIVNQVYYFLLLVGFVVAAVLMVRRRLRREERLIDWWVLPYGIAAYPTAIALVFSGQSRFHYPVMPFICMACGWLLVEIITRRCPDEATSSI